MLFYEKNKPILFKPEYLCFSTADSQIIGCVYNKYPNRGIFSFPKEEKIYHLSKNWKRFNKGILRI